MLKRHFYLITFALTFALTVMLGCARPTESPDPLANTAHVRVLHFSPGSACSQFANQWQSPQSGARALQLQIQFATWIIARITMFQLVPVVVS
jgi:hypothetical protein